MSRQIKNQQIKNRQMANKRPALRRVLKGILGGVILLMMITPLRAQIGVGVGVAAIGDNVLQAGGDLSDLFAKDSIRLGDVSGNIGFYGTLRFRLPIGGVRLLGDVSYIYFQKKEIELTEFSINPDSTANATFEVGTSMVPINVGATIAIPTPVVSPYAGASLEYTHISRTYTYLSGSTTLNTPSISNASAGDPEFGLALHVGAEIGLGPLLLDVGARYNFTNLFTTSDGEKAMRYLQIGASLFIGGKD